MSFHLLDELGALDVSGRSLNVDYGTLALNKPVVARTVFFDEESFHKAEDVLQPDLVSKYGEGRYRIRLTNLPETVPISILGQGPYEGKIVQFRGIVTAVQPAKKLTQYKEYECRAKNYIKKYYAPTIDDMLDASRMPKSGTLYGYCPECSRARGTAKMPLDVVKKNCVFVPAQRIAIQETITESGSGRIPAKIVGYLLDDLAADLVVVGEQVECVGIVYPDFRGSKAMTDVFVEVVSVTKLSASSEVSISVEDEDKIKDLATNPNIYNWLVESYAPIVYGYEELKLALLCSLVGSPRMDAEDANGEVVGSKIRGDIHALLVGDPGLAKSLLINQAGLLSPRPIYAAGGRATEAGLTASWSKGKDDIPELRPGAMVLADDGGICLGGESKVYINDEIVTIKSLFEKGINQRVSQLGQEVRDIVVPIQSHSISSGNRVLHRDIIAYATRIARLKYSGKMINLTFGSGMSLTLTPNHKLLTTGGKRRLWKEASKVIVGDRVRRPSVLYSNVNRSIDTKLAYLFGFIYGDGHLTKKGKFIQIRQSSKNNDIIKRLLEYAPQSKINTYTDKRPRVLVTHNKTYTLHNYTESCINITDKKIVAQYFIDYMRLGNLLSLDDKSLAAFYAGVLDSDGDINISHDKVIQIRIYPTMFREQLEILLHGLWRFGVRGRIREQKAQSIPIISITGPSIITFLDVVRPFSVKVNRRQLPLVREHRISIKEHEETIEMVSVVDVSDEYVYDLYLGLHHSFLASGVFVHNCIIDEIEKVKEADRQSLHKPMEDQFMPITMAGVTEVLNTRSPVVAACNPKKGRYDANGTLLDNVNLDPALLSRFDLIFIMRDNPDRKTEEELSKHMLRSHSSIREGPISLPLMRKYLSYCKRINPELVNDGEAFNMLHEGYMKVRFESLEGRIPPTPRVQQSLIRVSMALARMQLSPTVEANHAKMALELFEATTSIHSLDAELKEYTQATIPAHDEITVNRASAVRDYILVEAKRFGGKLVKTRVSTKFPDMNEVIDSVTEDLVKHGLIKDGGLFWVIKTSGAD